MFLLKKQRYLSKGVGIKGIQKSSFERTTDVTISLMAGGTFKVSTCFTVDLEMSSVFPRAMATMTWLAAGAIYHMDTYSLRKDKAHLFRQMIVTLCTCTTPFLPFPGCCVVHHVFALRRRLCLCGVFTSPALVVSPEVNADQWRGALVLPAGFRRAAGGDALDSDHLQPVWRLLWIQRDGVPVKSQVSHTAWAEEGCKCFKQATTHTGLWCTNFHFIFRECLTMPLALQVSCLAVSSCTASKQWDAFIIDAQVTPFIYLCWKCKITHRHKCNIMFFLSYYLKLLQLKRDSHKSIQDWLLNIRTTNLFLETRLLGEKLI